MKTEEQIELACTFWNLFNERKWDEAKDLLSDDFEAYWPQSDEKIKGRDNFINLNRDYPGTHKIQVLNTNSEYDQWDKTVTVITQVEIKTTTPEGKKVKLFAISFFLFRDEKILEVVEYWADTYPAPAWREKYVEKRTDS